MGISNIQRRSRRMLSMDVLEGRQLLAGNVTAAISLSTGNLLISLTPTQNQTITISEPNATTIRVSGNRVSSPPDVTTVNGVSFVDFTSTSVASISVQGTGGAGSQTVNLSTFATRTGAVTLNLGSGVNTVTANGVWSSQLSIATQSTVKANTFTLTNTKTGTTTINAGQGLDKITLQGGSFGTTAITTAGNADYTVTIGTSTAVSFAQLSFNEVKGNNNISVASATVANTANITVGSGANTIKFKNSTLGSSIIKAGSAQMIDVSNNKVTKVAGLSITANNVAPVVALNATISSNIINLGPLAINLGNDPTGIATLTANSNTVKKDFSVTIGDSFNKFTLVSNTIMGNENISLGHTSSILSKVSDNVTGNQAITFTNSNATLEDASAVGGNQSFHGDTFDNISLNISGGKITGTQAIYLQDNAIIIDKASPIGGGITVVARDFAAVTLDGINAPTSAISISVNNNATTVAATNITCSTLKIIGGDGSGDPDAPTFYLLTGDIITGEDIDGNGLDLRFGLGYNLVQLGTYDPTEGDNPTAPHMLTITYGINVIAADGGNNDVYVANTTAGYGTIDGGLGNTGSYYDFTPSTNSDNWVVVNFVNYP